MTLTIRLLGKPALARRCRPIKPPRGTKAWGLLAYLLLSPASRQSSAARRPALLGGRRSVWVRFGGPSLSSAGPWESRDRCRGDPPQLELPTDTVVDALLLTSGRPVASRVVGGAQRRTTGEGLSFASSPEFDSWLLVERRHLAGASEALLHDTALSRACGGEAGRRRCSLASEAVGLNPLHEGHHELLVRGLALSGDRSRGACPSRSLRRDISTRARSGALARGPSGRICVGSRARPTRRGAGGRLRLGNSRPVRPRRRPVRLSGARAPAAGVHGGRELRRSRSPRPRAGRAGHDAHPRRTGPRRGGCRRAPPGDCGGRAGR